MTNDQMPKTEPIISALQCPTFPHSGFGHSFFIQISAFFIGPSPLSRRPGHLPTPEQMEMQVVDCLATMGTAIDDNAVSFVQAQLSR